MEPMKYATVECTTEGALITVYEGGGERRTLLQPGQEMTLMVPELAITNVLSP